MSHDHTLESWFRRLRWALSRLPAMEGDEIVRETKAHIDDRCEAGDSITSILASFGPAELYARQFFDEMQIYEAMGAQRVTDLVGVIASRAHRNVIAAATLLVIVILSVVTFVTLFLVTLKIFDPVHTGIWTGPHVQLIGVIDDPHSARELLGMGLFPLAALILLVVWLGGRALLSFAVPLLMPRHSFERGPHES